jgi:hypothetical protein
MTIDFIAGVLSELVKKGEITAVLWKKYQFLESGGWIKSDYIRVRQVYKIKLTEKGTQLLQQIGEGVV